MSGSTRACAAIVAAGVALRAGMLLAAPELRLVADESSYAYLGLAWQRFGFLPDLVDFLWPPLYPGALAWGFLVAGADGLFAIKVLQVVLAGGVGFVTALLARRIFGERAAVLAASLWAAHLPLAAYTHTVRPETLFLALLGGASLLALDAFEDPDDDPGSWLRLAGCGLLVGAALLVKQVAAPIAVAVCTWLALDRRQGRIPERALRVAVFALAVGVVTLPWALRNLDVYGHAVVGGSTLGRNLHHGVNGHYRNFDYEAQGFSMRELYADQPTFLRTFVEDPRIPVWESSKAPNVIERSAENSERARAWALEHPAFFATTRIKKLADWVSPLSFYVASVGRGLYDETMLGGFLRRASVLGALATTGLVLTGGVLGLALAPCSSRHRLFLLGLLACIAASAPIVSIARYRLPAEPLLIVLAAGWIAHARDRFAPDRGSIIAATFGLATLVLLWTLNSREIVQVLHNALD